MMNIGTDHRYSRGTRAVIAANVAAGMSPNCSVWTPSLSAAEGIFSRLCWDNMIAKQTASRPTMMAAREMRPCRSNTCRNSASCLGVSRAGCSTVAAAVPAGIADLRALPRLLTTAN
jgi:hypothetical protein